MSRSERLTSLLPPLFALLMVLATPVEGRTFGSVEMGLREVSVSYKSFDANYGGLPNLGARYRSDFFEAGLMKLGNGTAFEVAYNYKFDPGRWLVPRLILGLAYLGEPAVVQGVGLSFPLISLGGGRYIGLDLDSYLYLRVSGGKLAIRPVIPISLSFIF